MIRAPRIVVCDIAQRAWINCRTSVFTAIVFVLAFFRGICALCNVRFGGFARNDCRAAPVLEGAVDGQLVDECY